MRYYLSNPLFLAIGLVLLVLLNRSQGTVALIYDAAAAIYCITNAFKKEENEDLAR